MASIQIYAESVFVEPSGIRAIEVSLNGVTVDDIVAQFSVEEILNEIELSDIHDYVKERLEDGSED